MHDLPFQGLYQQSHARSISGEDLETFGKTAAEKWLNGDAATLNEAVVSTIKQAGLSPEQVRRVIEFTNTTAYLREFNKEGSAHKVIEFPGGPADPSFILKDLNDGGGGSVFDRGMLDYDTVPSYSKTASESSEQAFREAFTSEKVAGYELQNAYKELEDLREKIASHTEFQSSLMGGLEVMYMDLSNRLFDHVKQASLAGHSLGEVVQVWAQAEEDPFFMKVAFDMLTPRLLENQVFRTLGELSDSVEKTGAIRAVNPNSPLLSEFSEFCGVLTKLADTREELKQSESALSELNTFFSNPSIEKVGYVMDRLAKMVAGAGKAAPAAHQVASKVKPGFIKKVVDQAASMGEAVTPHAQRAGEVLFGQGSEAAQQVGNAVGSAVKYAPHAAGAALGLRGYQHAKGMLESPLGQTVSSFIPGTNANAQKQQEINMRYSGYPFPTY